MFLKTESFEHNGVTVTLSELSALQRIEHLALAIMMTSRCRMIFLLT